jgi:hypothetical protein
MPPSRLPPTIRTPGLWRSLFAQSMAGGLFPKEQGYDIPWEKNITYTYHVHGCAPVVAILDALSLVHVGSTTGDSLLLLEARKRYVCAIESLRLDASRPKPKMPLAEMMTVAMGILMSEVQSYLSPRPHGLLRAKCHLDMCCSLLIHRKTYSAVSEESTPTAWQGHTAGVSALVCVYRRDVLDSTSESYLLQQIRTAQVCYRNVPVSPWRLMTRNSSFILFALGNRSLNSTPFLRYQHIRPN